MSRDYDYSVVNKSLQVDAIEGKVNVRVKAGPLQIFW